MKQFFVSCMFLCCTISGFAQPGFLDPSFGKNGVTKADLGKFFPYSSAASQVLIGPDGRAYVVMSTGAAGTVVARVFANGYIDSAYGIDGYSRTVHFAIVAAAFQPDGKIVLAGSGGRTPSGIARLNANGKLDLTYGNKGIQDIDFTPSAIAVQPDGKSVVAGSYGPGEGFVVSRFNTNGSTDDTFNGGIPAVTVFPGDNGGGPPAPFQTGTAYTVALQPDGKIVVAGDCVIDEFSGFKFAAARYNTDGSTDNSFNGNGKQVISFDPPGQVVNARAYSVLITAGTKILLGGYTSRPDGPGNDFALARLNNDGSPDYSFDGDGIQTTTVGCDAALANSLSVQADGKIVQGGYTPSADGPNDFLIARYNDDGSPDNSFDGDGIAVTDLQTSDDYAGSVKVLSNGKIIIAGYSYVGANSVFSIAKYNGDGSPDNTFGPGADGKMLDRNCHCNTQFFTSAVQTDGKIIAAGRTWNGSNFDFGIARFKTNGTIDSTFSDDGRQLTNFMNDDEIKSIVLQPDGKILAVGNINYSQGIGIARYNADGTRDAGFGSNGKITTAFGVMDVSGNISLQKNGKIVIAGYTIPDLFTGNPVFVVARYNSDGTPDNTFGDNGKQFAGFGPEFKGVGRAAVIQTDGKIVMAGRVNFDGQDNFALCRFNADGTIDNTFGNSGYQTSVFSTDNYMAESIALQSDGKIVVGGYRQDNLGTNTRFVAARYNTDGQPDAGFGSGGYVEAGLGAYNFNFGLTVAVAPNGKIAIGGTNDNFAIAMFNANGTIDYNYNGTGSTSTEVGLAGATIHSILFSGNYIYATGFGAFPQHSGVVARYLLVEGGPLPVTLLDFKGTLQNKKTVLQWQTENETDLAAYEVQRSATGTHFKPIDYVNATGGNSQQTNYSLVDEAPLNGINLYRLRMIDKDGKYTYSKTIAVNNKGEVLTLKIMPNPVVNTLYINANGATGNAVVSIFDVSGRKVTESNVVLTAEAPVKLSAAELPKGIYSLQLVSGGKKETVRFVKY